jgi:amino acid transporter
MVLFNAIAFVRRKDYRMTTYQRTPIASSFNAEEYVVKAMPPILGSYDMTTTFIVVLFFITNVPNVMLAGPATFSLWIAGGIFFFLPCLVTTAQLATMFPGEGSLYLWANKVLGPRWSFFVGICAWIPAPLLIISTGDLVITYLQGLNPTWLTQPWQQGVALIVVLMLSAVVAIQRYRTVQNIVNITAWLIGLAVAIVGIAGLVWLAKGHSSATSFSHLSDWNLNYDIANGNLFLFGTIILAYLGVNIPLNMAGEIMDPKTTVIKRHLLWGPLLVLIGYFVVTFSSLVVEGQNGAFNLFGIVGLVDAVLGKGVGDIVAMCVMTTFFVATVVYNYAYARFIFIGGVDRRLPTSMGMLNKHRIPAPAIWFQTIFACVIILLVFVLAPFLIRVGAPAVLAAQIYNIFVACGTLLWAFSTLFLFIITLALLNQLSKREAKVVLHASLIFPRSLLRISCIFGLLAGSLGIVLSIAYSWIPQQIANGQWELFVGGITLTVIFIVGIISLVARSEADWQGLVGDIDE